MNESEWGDMIDPQLDVELDEISPFTPGESAGEDAGESAGEDAGGPTLYYGSVDEFLREFLRKAYVRRIDGKGQGNVWAAQWWTHIEAVHRLEALWRAWEQLRLDPATGMSVWWRDHADHHMPILLSSEGPFRGAVGPDDHCFPDKGEWLPYAHPPAGLYPDVRQLDVGN